LSISSSRALPSTATPAALPPRLRVEHALLDEVHRTRTAGETVGLVLQVLQRRVTTAERVRRALVGHQRLPRRRLLVDLLDEAQDGVQSRLEHRYLQDVERAHGLPRGTRNRAEPQVAQSGRRAGTRYRDVRYRGYTLVVELDGEAAHPVTLRWQDRLRDNAGALGGDLTLRHGWFEIATMPCTVAGQVVVGLRAGGWRGTPERCGPGCPLVSVGVRVA